MKSFLVHRRAALEKRRGNGIPTQDGQPGGILALLPVELILLIVLHLDSPADAIAVLNVCHAWRSVLLSPDIWRPLSDRLLPGLSAHLAATCPSTEAQGRGFHVMLRQRQLRRLGHFNFAILHGLRMNLNGDRENGYFTVSKRLPPKDGGVFSLDSIPALNPEAEDEHVTLLKIYSHGRIAWWPEGWSLPWCAIVDDLRTRTRRMFLFPSPALNTDPGPTRYADGIHAKGGWRTSMGELLFVMGQETVGVCVWHLERDEMREVKLPSSFERCLVAGERLLFVGRRAAELWMWTWDTNKVETIDAPGQGCYLPGVVTLGGQPQVLGFPLDSRRTGLRFRDSNINLDFILHPTDPNVLFILTYNGVDVVVYELTSGKLTDRIQLPHCHLGYRILQHSPAGSSPQYLRHERCDAYGTYCLLTTWVESYTWARSDAGSFCGGACTGSSPEFQSVIGSVCFNVYTKQFTAFVHHGISRTVRGSHLWDGMLAVITYGWTKHKDGSSSESKAFVALLNPCDGSSDTGVSLQQEHSSPVGMIALPTATSPAPLAEKVLLTTTHKDGTPLDYRLDRIAYVLDTGMPDNRRLAMLDVVEWINGDDNTLIYVSGKKYTIWGFGDEWGRQEKKGWTERWRSVVGVGRGGSKS
ncbi:hypothetical protein QBC47DRAFT_385102 [Echria macrotheca]|uniref:F-box domain-containing protein n=1 Tax=Echria macrotheca TaxID=438768 RepID=A0AAJ0B8X3_9PEZI|nr:hypothetical protein QBC47DRAFT_385102 [Echria macrotheca]